LVAVDRVALWSVVLATSHQEDTNEEDDVYNHLLSSRSGRGPCGVEAGLDFEQASGGVVKERVVDVEAVLMWG